MDWLTSEFDRQGHQILVLSENSHETAFSQGVAEGQGMGNGGRVEEECYGEGSFV